MPVNARISEPLLRELAPTTFLANSATLHFRQQRDGLMRGPSLVALLVIAASSRRGTLRSRKPGLTLVQRTLGPRTTHAGGASVGRQLLVVLTLVTSRSLGVRWERLRR